LVHAVPELQLLLLPPFTFRNVCVQRGGGDSETLDSEASFTRLRFEK